VCFALAAAARWEDSSIVDCGTFLPAVLETALSRRELSPTQVSALSSLLDQLSVELIVRIVEEASEQRGGLDLKALTEELAREELLRFGRGTRQQVSEQLSSLLTESVPGFWLDRLVQATRFHQVERPGRTSSPSEEKQSSHRVKAKAKRPDPLDNIDWAAHRFISTEAITDVIGQTHAAARASETFVSVSTILERIRDVVALGDRVVHLEALSRIESQEVPDYELAQAIARCIDHWLCRVTRRDGAPC
jgi:hypothetical protein